MINRKKIEKAEKDKKHRTRIKRKALKDKNNNLEDNYMASFTADDFIKGRWPKETKSL